MTVSDNGFVVALIAFALDLAAAVALDSFDKAISDTHYNAGVVCCAVIVRVLEEYLVTDFRGLVKSSNRLVVFQRKAAACALVAGLTLKIFGFVLASAKLEKAPVNKLVAPVIAVFVAVVVTCFVQVP